MATNTITYNTGDQAAKVAKAILEETSEPQFLVQETPLVTMPELILAFTNLGCTVELQRKPRGLMVRKKQRQF